MPSVTILTLALAMALQGATAAAEDPRTGTAAAASDSQSTSHRLMLLLLRSIAGRTPNENPYLGDFRARKLRREYTELPAGSPLVDRWKLLDSLGLAEFYTGNFSAALERQKELYDLTPKVINQLTNEQVHSSLFDLGMTHMRIGETVNCALQHSPDSCILPIRGGGIHRDQVGSRQAIRFFTEMLERPGVEAGLAMQARWLLNIAFMTIDEYPQSVPREYLIPPSAFASEIDFPEFEEVAARLGLDTFGMSGGVIIDDFDNDLDLDLLVSDWHPGAQLRLWRNNADGTFTEITEAAGLIGLFGGLNMVQADYDNDGDVDAYVLRGAWLGRAGRHPNSLLRNNGDSTFTDVTFEARLGNDRLPTQTASWADYDNDGDVDLFVATESTPDMSAPSLLYRNNGDGTFDEVGREAGVENLRYCKGSNWGDFDGDRWPDLYLSNIAASNRLYRNNRDGTFTDIAPQLGVDKPRDSFPTWFWDYDNDGVLDIFVNSYPRNLAQTAVSYLGGPVAAELARLYRGDGEGGFSDVSARVGLDKVLDPMGANFGDLDGDGFLDFYLGTGFPPFHAISPNTMYLNQAGERFVDVTVAGRFGHLQKGHGIAFADLDHDGDNEVFAVMGGAVPGDEFHDVLWENPGFGNHWLTVRLVGVTTNRSAIGARITVTIEEGESQRQVVRFVNSGGSFGANPLRQTIGLGRAERIQLLEVYWPTSDTWQRFPNVELDSSIEIVEGREDYRKIELPRFRLTGNEMSQTHQHSIQP